MCGLAAIVSTPAHFPSKSRLEDVAMSLRHRGPDNSNIEILKSKVVGVALVHTRLAIIDQSAAANQPLSSDDERWSLVFNGEIYNYIELRSELSLSGANFTTSSDTEVLLAAIEKWGLSSLSRLRGMFSFVVVDRLKETLYAVRDPFGVKPLFIASTSTGIGFASEIATLQLLIPRADKIDDETVLDYILTGRYDQSSRTFFQGVKSVPPGSVVSVDFSGPVIQHRISHWFQRPSTDILPRSIENSAQELRERLFLSVERQLRSDVDVAVSLSGGLDSSAICAAIRQLHPNGEINTFSFVLPGVIQDESEWSQRVANHLGTNHQRVQINATDIPYFFHQTLAAQGEPFGSSSAVAQFAVYEALRQAGFKVVLEGQGADETLAGYQGFPEYRLLSYLRAHELTGGFKFLVGWQANPSHSLLDFGARTLAMLAKNKGRLEWARIGQYLLSSSRVVRWPALRRFLEHPEEEVTQEPPEEGLPRALVSRLSQVIFGGPLLPLLRHGDRSSMANSVENRVPFLDIDLVSTALSLPEKHLVSPEGITKYALRRAIEDYLPSEVVWRKDKVGFEGNDLAWLKIIDSNPDKLLAPLEHFAWIDIDRCRQLLRKTWVDDEKYSRLVWRLACLSHWIKEKT